MIERVEFDSGHITVEYELAPRMVVFSHDFASLRDDHGLLSDIASHLPKGFGYVLFDYYDTDETGKYIQIKTFAEQVRRLNTVLDWIHSKPGVEQVDIVAHSLGCIVVAKLNPMKVRRMLLLAPPTTIGNDMQHYFEQAGAKQTAGIWRIERPDKITISIPDTFFTEVKRLDGEAELNELALQHEYIIILPSQDEILNDVDYTGLMVMPNVHAEAVDETNHFFEGRGREQLLQLIQQNLTSEQLAY